MHPCPSGPIAAAEGSLAWVEQGGRSPMPHAVFRASAIGRMGGSPLSLALPDNATALVRSCVVCCWGLGCRCRRRHCCCTLGCSTAHPCGPPHPAQAEALAAGVRNATQAGFLVRARTDADTVEARAGFTARRDAIIAAGPQVRGSGACCLLPLPAAVARLACGRSGTACLGGRDGAAQALHHCLPASSHIPSFFHAPGGGLRFRLPGGSCPASARRR